MKSCLNCTLSGFVIEKHGEIYTYEGDCNDTIFPLTEIIKVLKCKKDDKQELKDELEPIFAKVGSKCRFYNPVSQQ